MYQVLKGKKAPTLSAYEPKRSISGRRGMSAPAKAGALRLVIIAAHPNVAQSRWRRDPLPATVIIVAVAAPPVPPPRPANEEDPAVAMHEMAVAMNEMAVIKVVPIADMTIPGRHMTGPCGHSGTAGNQGSAMAVPATEAAMAASKTMAATATAMTKRHSKRGQHYNC